VTGAAWPAGTTGPRPRRPPRSPLIAVAAVGFLAMTAWSWVGIGFSPAELIEKADNARRIVDDSFPIAWEAWGAIVGPLLETLRMAVVGAVIGCLLALGVGFLASRITAPNPATYGLSKTVMSVVRSIPDVLYALLFVAAVSIGPLAGVLALVFFNIGVVAKLLSETVDAVDVGPLEAADAAGATVLQRIRSSVFPQVLPNYLAYALYTFELNIRASVVLGLVGAGGIGQLLRIAQTRYRYDVIALIILVTFVLVFLVEAVSISLRRRLS
jgi:phosphonate transport system permease protein